MLTSETLATINLTIIASTERQWQAIRHPKGPAPVQMSSAQTGMTAGGIKRMTRRRAIASWVHQAPPWFYVERLPLALFPWFFLALASAG